MVLRVAHVSVFSVFLCVYVFFVVFMFLCCVFKSKGFCVCVFFWCFFLFFFMCFFVCAIFFSSCFVSVFCLFRLCSVCLVCFFVCCVFFCLLASIVYHFPVYRLYFGACSPFTYNIDYIIYVKTSVVWSIFPSNFIQWSLDRIDRSRSNHIQQYPR